MATPRENHVRMIRQVHLTMWAKRILDGDPLMSEEDYLSLVKTSWPGSKERGLYKAAKKAYLSQPIHLSKTRSSIDHDREVIEGQIEEALSRQQEGGKSDGTF